MVRKIHIGSDVWTYSVGQMSVVITPPTGRKITASFEELVGRNFATVEQARRAALNDATGEPLHIKTYIERLLIRRSARLSGYVMRDANFVKCLHCSARAYKMCHTKSRGMTQPHRARIKELLRTFPNYKLKRLVTIPE